MTDGLLLPPGGGRRIQTMTLKVAAEQSKIWSAFEAEVAPGFDVGAHLHHHAEEVFYVLEGELDLLAFQPAAKASGDLRTWESTTGTTVFRGRAGEFHVRSRWLSARLLQPGPRAGPYALPRIPGRPRDLPQGTRRPACRRRTTRPSRDRSATAPPRHPSAHAPHKPPARAMSVLDVGQFMDALNSVAKCRHSVQAPPR